jgi:hypothetical protein
MAWGALYSVFAPLFPRAFVVHETWIQEGALFTEWVGCVQEAMRDVKPLARVCALAPVWSNPCHNLSH